MELSWNEHIEGTIEAILFVSDKPVTLEQFKEVLETVNAADIKQAIANLQKEYEEKKRGMMILEIAGGYQMLSSSGYAMAIRRFYKTKHKEKLSKPSLESLAIVAYKQPVTRTDIELIRGVNSDGVAEHLLAKGLIEIVGRKEVPGRPFMYGTTKKFLEYFGLKSLEDLPKLEEFLLQSLDKIDAENKISEQPEQESGESSLATQEETQKESAAPVESDIKTDGLMPKEDNVIKKEVETFLKEAQEFAPEETESENQPTPVSEEKTFVRRKSSVEKNIIEPQTPSDQQSVSSQTDVLKEENV